MDSSILIDSKNLNRIYLAERYFSNPERCIGAADGLTSTPPPAEPLPFGRICDGPWWCLTIPDAEPAGLGSRQSANSVGLLIQSRNEDSS